GLHDPVGAGGGQGRGGEARRTGGHADGRHAAGVGRGDIERRVADDDDLAGAIEAPPGQRLGAPDAAPAPAGRPAGARGEAAEAEGAPQIGVAELDLGAALDVAGGQADEGPTLLEDVEGGVDPGEDLVAAGLTDEGGEVGEVALDEALDVGGGRRPAEAPR